MSEEGYLQTKIREQQEKILNLENKMKQIEMKILSFEKLDIYGLAEKTEKNNFTISGLIKELKEEIKYNIDKKINIISQNLQSIGTGIKGDITDHLIKGFEITNADARRNAAAICVIATYLMNNKIIKNFNDFNKSCDEAESTLKKENWSTTLTFREKRDGSNIEAMKYLLRANPEIVKDVVSKQKKEKND